MAQAQPTFAAIAALLQHPSMRFFFGIAGAGLGLWAGGQWPSSSWGNFLGGGVPKDNSTATTIIIKTAAAFVPSPNVLTASIFGLPDTICVSQARLPPLVAAAPALLPALLPAATSPAAAAFVEGADVPWAFAPSLLFLVGLLGLVSVVFAFGRQLTMGKLSEAEMLLAWTQGQLDVAAKDLFAALVREQDLAQQLKDLDGRHGPVQARIQKDLSEALAAAASASAAAVTTEAQLRQQLADLTAKHINELAAALVKADKAEASKSQLRTTHLQLIDQQARRANTVRDLGFRLREAIGKLDQANLDIKTRNEDVQRCENMLRMRYEENIKLRNEKFNTYKANYERFAAKDKQIEALQAQIDALQPKTKTMYTQTDAVDLISAVISSSTQTDVQTVSSSTAQTMPFITISSSMQTASPLLSLQVPVSVVSFPAVKPASQPLRLCAPVSMVSFPAMKPAKPRLSMSVPVTVFSSAAVQPASQPLRLCAPVSVVSFPAMKPAKPRLSMSVPVTVFSSAAVQPAIQQLTLCVPVSTITITVKDPAATTPSIPVAEPIEDDTASTTATDDTTALASPLSRRVRATLRAALCKAYIERAETIIHASDILIIVLLPCFDPLFADIDIPQPVDASTPKVELCVDCRQHYTSADLHRHLPICRKFFDSAVYCHTTGKCYVDNAAFKEQHRSFCTQETCGEKTVRPEKKVLGQGVPGAPTGPKYMPPPGPRGMGGSRYAGRS